MPRDSSLVSTLVSSMSGVAESLFATFFPSDCRLCGTPLANISRLPVCPPCLSDLQPIEGKTCSVCGERLLSPHAVVAEGGEARCGLCQRAAPPFVRAVAYGSYEGGLRELIHLLKYEQVRPAAGALGRMLAQAVAGLESLWSQPQISVVSVPLHARKLRQRGFNQTELIVREALKVSAEAGRLVLRSGEFCNGDARPYLKSGSRGISGVKIFVELSSLESLTWLVDAKSYSWTTSLRPARRFRNARGFCSGQAHLRYM